MNPEREYCLSLRRMPQPLRVAHQQAQVEAICRQAGAWELRLARDDDERLLMWRGRKAAFAAMRLRHFN